MTVSRSKKLARRKLYRAPNAPPPQGRHGHPLDRTHFAEMERLKREGTALDRELETGAFFMEINKMTDEEWQEYQAPVEPPGSGPDDAAAPPPMVLDDDDGWAAWLHRRHNDSEPDAPA